MMTPPRGSNQADIRSGLSPSAVASPLQSPLPSPLPPRRARHEPRSPVAQNTQSPCARRVHTRTPSFHSQVSHQASQHSHTLSYAHSQQATASATGDPFGLIPMLTRTQEHLSAVWSEIGVTDTEEQKARITALATRVRNAFRDAVVEVNTERDKLRQRIAEMRQECELIVQQLDMHPRPTLPADNSSLPLRTRADAIEQVFTVLNAKREARMNELQELLSSLRELWEQIGAPGWCGDQCTVDVNDPEYVRIDRHSDLTSSRTRDLASKVDAVRQRCNQHKEQRRLLCLDMEALLRSMNLDEHELSEADRLLLKNGTDEVCRRSLFDLTQHTLEALQQRRDVLAAEKQRREAHLRRLAADITRLWKLLGVPQEAQKEFLSQYQGLGLRTIQACEQCLRQLNQDKRRRLRELLGQSVQRLRELWERSHTPVEERMASCAFAVQLQGAYEGDDCEARLQQVQDACERAQQRLQLMAPLLTLIERRDAILRQKAAHDIAEQDPNRFKIPGMMLKLEKFRRVLKSTLPKLTAKLRSALQEYESRFGHFCLQDGRRYLDVLNEWERAHAPAQKRKSVFRSLGAPSTSSASSLPQQQQQQQQQQQSQSQGAWPRARTRRARSVTSNARQHAEDFRRSQMQHTMAAPRRDRRRSVAESPSRDRRRPTSRMASEAGGDTKRRLFGTSSNRERAPMRSLENASSRPSSRSSSASLWGTSRRNL
ncbi:MAG: hypothetical protein MHM6MM_006025 [Cercozoa sp. M6MM]